MYMWFMEAKGLNAKTVVFSEAIMKEFLDSGYQVTAKYKILLVEGSDYLPDYIGED